MRTFLVSAIGLCFSLGACIPIPTDPITIDGVLPISSDNPASITFVRRGLFQWGTPVYVSVDQSVIAALDQDEFTTILVNPGTHVIWARYHTWSWLLLVPPIPVSGDMASKRLTIECRPGDHKYIGIRMVFLASSEDRIEISEVSGSDLRWSTNGKTFVPAGRKTD